MPTRNQAQACYPKLYEFLRRSGHEFNDADYRRTLLKFNSYDNQVYLESPPDKVVTPGDLGMVDSAVAFDLVRLREQEARFFTRTGSGHGQAWVPHLADYFGIMTLYPPKCQARCPRGACCCYDACVEAPSEPTLLDNYNKALQADIEAHEAVLRNSLEQQRTLNASIKTQRDRLASVDDFPKNSRYIVVSKDGTQVYVNLVKDADGVWFKNGIMVTWLNVYDVFVTNNWGSEVEFIQVRPARNIPHGKDFKGYGAPAPAKKTAAKKTVARKTAAKRPAVKRVTKKAV